MSNSRLALITDAVRPALKARLLLAGPPGSGKTFTGLEVAGLLAEGGPVLVIDTERADDEHYAALTFADVFEEQFGYQFKHMPWHPPYDPREFAEVIGEVTKDYAVVMADSVSHFWAREGGTLDIAGGKFTGWAGARPAQQKFVDAVIAAPSHMILCCRMKVEHAQELEGGKHVVRKLGMAVKQDDDLESEMNVFCQLDMEHRLTLSKSRCPLLPVGAYFQPGDAGKMAKIYGGWLKSGKPQARSAETTALKELLNSGIEDRDARIATKKAFVAEFGDLALLEAEHLDAAKAWVEARVAAAKAPRGDTQQASSPPVAPPAVEVPPVEKPKRQARSKKHDGDGFGPDDDQYEPVPERDPEEFVGEGCPHPWPWVKNGQMVECGGPIPCRLFKGGLPADEESARRLLVEKQAAASGTQPTLGG